MDPKVYDYLYSLNRLGSKPGLERIQKMLDLLGNPEKKFKSIHFTGTNGKGSTIAFTYFALKENNYRVGVFTSPHLENARERIQVCRELLAKHELYVAKFYFKSKRYKAALGRFESVLEHYKDVLPISERREVLNSISGCKEKLSEEIGEGVDSS